MVKVQLSTVFIPESRQVYSLFPGEGYKFRRVIEEDSVLFLDFPNLEIPDSREATFKSDFVNELLLADQVAAWIKGGRKAEKSPYREDAERPTRLSQKRQRNLNALQVLFFDLEEGDLVVVPAPGAFGELLIGEVSSSKMKRLNIQPYVEYNESFAARRVRWLAKISQHKLSAEFLQSIRNQNPLSVVGQSFRQEIYSAAYKSYVYGSRMSSKFTVAGEDYDSFEELLLHRFSNFVAAAHSASAKPRSDLSFKGMSIWEAITSHKDDDYVPELAISISSPGFIDLISNKVTPLVMAAVFALAIAACQPNGEVKNYVGHNVDQVEVVFDKPTTDPCSAEVIEATRDVLRIMGYDQWQEMCKSAILLEEGSKVSSPAKVTE